MKCPKCETVNPDGSKFCRECATPLPSGPQEQASFTRTLETSTDELTRGMLFAGRYEIIEELGAGGMGRVYRVFDKKIEEEVALKLIRPEIAAEKRTVERFRNEIKIARKIRHAHVCGMHDLHEEGKTLFLTMEYVRGEDLKSFLKQSRTLSVGTAVSIARQVAEGLGEAHRLGVVHRDLKPGNIMIDKDGNAKIMDFGIARSLAAGAGTAEGAIVGTPEYMSPEQVEGKPADQRSDVYALGVILFEAVTGRLPFEGDTALAVAHKHKYEPTPDPRTLNPQLPMALSKLILRSMEKEAEKRYQTTEGFLGDLEAIEAALPTTERAPALKPSSSHRPSASKTITVKLTPRKLVIPAAALALLAATLLLWRPWSRDEGPPVFYSDRPSIAILNLANRTGQKDLDQYRDVLPAMISDDLSQSRYIYVVPPEQVSSVLARRGLLKADKYTAGDLRAIGRRGVVRHLASGHYTKAGEKLLIRLTIQEAETGKVIGTEEVQGTGVESFFDMADELTLRIKPLLELTAAEIANDSDGRLDRVTTSSIEAYQHYLRGVNLAGAIKYADAIGEMEKAIALDQEFAMAYRALSTYHLVLRNTGESQKNIQKALELSRQQDRLPLRERLLIEAQAESDAAKRIEIYSRLLDLYPNDITGNVNLGVVYGELGDYGQAAERFSVPVRNRNDRALSYRNLAYAYSVLGKYEEAEDVLNRFIKDFSGNPGIAAVHRSMAHVRMVQAKFKPALKALEESSRLGPQWIKENTRSRARVLALMGEYAKAETLLRGLFDEGDYPGLAFVHQDLARLQKAQGRFRAAAVQLLRAQEESEKRSLIQHAEELRADQIEYRLASGDIDGAEAKISGYRIWLIGLGTAPDQNGAYLTWRSTLLSMRRESMEASRHSSMVLAIYEKNPNNSYRGFALRLQGIIELERGEFEKAIELLVRAKSHIPFESSLPTTTLPTREFHAFYMEPLALAYFRSGDLEKARQEYEAITRLTTGRLAYGDIYARSFYMLGQIYEQMGKKKPARANYRNFLDLWKDADPGLPEVADAKKRLAAIR